MADVVIRTEGLGKSFRIGAKSRRHSRLGEIAVDSLLSPIRKAHRLLRGEAAAAANLTKEFWALKEVAFEVRRGELVGIIGANGAGKSTLLKILSQITEPTHGYVEILGRVGCLLEVGTGFHPELTGRENIYLNGAILGMKRAEIDRKFDEIVSFAGVDEFLDTPVKHYSSGMYVRLAFSVAAHLEPEILLIDEVLAVGDTAFQRKCLSKMDDVTTQGRTVLFVSHNLGIMRALTKRGIYLEKGRVVVDGTIDEAVAAYHASIEDSLQEDISERSNRRGRGLIRLTHLEITNGNGNASLLTTGGSVRFEFRLNGILPGTSIVFSIFNQFGERIATFRSDAPGPNDGSLPERDSKFVCELERLLLPEGRYRVGTLIRGGGEWQDHMEAAATFTVHEGLLDGRVIHSNDQIRVCIPHRWMVPAGRS